MRSSYLYSLTNMLRYQTGGCCRPERLALEYPWSSPSGFGRCLRRCPLWEDQQSREQGASFIQTALCVQHFSTSHTMTIDSSYVGRYGTLSLMKKDGSSIPVAHYPIDDGEITIGRDPNCSVRLYYDSISKLHCKVTFEDTKVRTLQPVDETLLKDISGVLNCLWDLRSCGGWFPSFPDRCWSNNRTSWQQYGD